MVLQRSAKGFVLQTPTCRFRRKATAGLYPSACMWMLAKKTPQTPQSHIVCLAPLSKPVSTQEVNKAQQKIPAERARGGAPKQGRTCPTGLPRAIMLGVRIEKCAKQARMSPTWLPSATMHAPVRVATSTTDVTPHLFCANQSASASVSRPSASVLFT